MHQYMILERPVIGIPFEWFTRGSLMGHDRPQIETIYVLGSTCQQNYHYSIWQHPLAKEYVPRSSIPIKDRLHRRIKNIKTIFVKIKPLLF